MIILFSMNYSIYLNLYCFYVYEYAYFPRGGYLPPSWNSCNYLDPKTKCLCSTLSQLTLASGFTLAHDYGPYNCNSDTLFSI